MNEAYLYKLLEMALQASVQECVDERRLTEADFDKKFNKLKSAIWKHFEEVRK